MTNYSNASARMPLASTDGSTISIGNAALTGHDHGGWFVGSFLSNEARLRHTDGLEVKWGLHVAGDVRTDVNDRGGMHSLAILITGTFVIEFPALREEVMLSQAGDYVLYGPDVAHTWRAIEASTVVTVRWAVPESR
jgi:hypothetical protein